MFLTDQGLELIEEQADKAQNVNLMFLVQILKETRKIRTLLEIYQDSSNCGSNRSQSNEVADLEKQIQDQPHAFNLDDINHYLEKDFQRRFLQNADSVQDKN